MTPEEFSKGTMFYKACCGQELDPENLRVWYEMLKDMDADRYQGAIKLFISEEENPARMNFVATVNGYAKQWDREQRHQRYLARIEQDDLEEKKYRQKFLAERSVT